MSDTLPQLDKVESSVRVVSASVSEVEQAIRDATSRYTVLLPANPFAAEVSDGQVRMVKREGRNPMRAEMRATLEAVAGGTRITAHAGLPPYARWVGRAAALAALLVGVVQLAWLTLAGRPQDMPQMMYFAMLASAVWMPMVAWIIPGMLVNRSVAQRSELLEHLDSAIAPLGRLPMQEATSSTPSRSQARRQEQ